MLNDLRCDNDSFLNSNRVPIDKMIAYLKKYFSPDLAADDAYSLAISAGEDGARLTHSHARQYNFALQVTPFLFSYILVLERRVCTENRVGVGWMGSGLLVRLVGSKARGRLASDSRIFCNAHEALEVG